jgi:hypothetical protein
MLPIFLRSGSKGQRIYPGLEELSDQTRILDVNLTWEDAFRDHFGVTTEFDPNKFAVQKAVYRGQPNKHKITEEVCLHLF